MARRTPSALALVPAAVLLLTGCGSSASPHHGHGIAGAASGSGSSGAPSAPASDPPGAPSFRLPSDVRVDIAAPAPGGAEANAAASGLEYAIRALRDGFSKDDGQVAPMVHAYASDAGLFWSARIARDKARGRTITGTYRYYDIAVRTRGGSAATATFCEDQREAFAKDVTTGKVYRTAPSDKDFYAFTALMRKDAAGTWQIYQESWKQGDSTCVNG